MTDRLPIEIRWAADAEAAACRALLPRLFAPTGPSPELIVAVDGAAQVAGALALLWTEGGFAFDVAVEARVRRRGIGSALVREAIAAARGETHALRTASAVDVDGEPGRFLRSLGFAESRRFRRFSMGVDIPKPQESRVERKRMIAHARMPAGFLIVGPSEAPLDQVARLAASAFSTVPYVVAQGLARGAAHGGYDPDLSPIALQDGEVVGLALSRRLEDVAEVEAIVVAPQRRWGPTFMLLLDALGRLGSAAGLRGYRFSCEPHLRDTLKLAALLGAVDLPDQAVFAHPV